MRLEATDAGALKRFRRTATTFFQRTFAKPGERAADLARALVPDQSPITGASVVVEAVVFEPTHLYELFEMHHLSLRYDQLHYRHHSTWTIVASGTEESRALLMAALTDGIDFYFIPEPRVFLLYADHDDYATLFASRKGALSRLSTVASGLGVAEVTDFHRWSDQSSAT